jgi:hypothetical protein
MLGLLGVVLPRWPRPLLRRSRQAVLDISCNIFVGSHVRRDRKADGSPKTTERDERFAAEECVADG